MADTSPQTLAQIQQAQAILNSPEVQNYQRQGGTFVKRAEDYARLLKSKGVVIPKGYTISDNGQIVEDHALRNGILMGGVALGGPIAAGLLAPAAAVPAASSGGGMTAAGAAAAPSALSSSILGAAAGGGSVWSKLAPALISASGNTVASLVGSHAAGKAADQESAAADKALALQREMWQTTQANQAPYLQAGSGAITRLNNLMGGTPMAPSSSLANLQPQPPTSNAGMVNMRAPDGSVRPIPSAQVSFYQQKGAQVVS